MNDQVGEVLKVIIPSATAMAWLLGILVVAAILYFKLSKRGRRPNASNLALWLSGLLFPVLVLLLTWPALVLDQSIAPVHRHAWISLWLIILGLRMIDSTLDVATRRRARPPLPPLLHRLVTLVLYAAAFLVVLRFVLNVNITPLLATSAVLTMVLGFALQGVLGNLLAGMSLSLVRTVEVGDLIRVGEVEGRVVHTNWRETLLHTRDDDYVHVPNNTLASEMVTNFSKPEQLHRHAIDVGASYSDAPAEVIEALIEAARESGVAYTEPAPAAFITAYLDFGINYRLFFWTNNYWQRRRLEGEVARHIWYKFKRRGIEIPFPMSDKLLNDFMEVVYTQRRLPPDTEAQQRMAEILGHSEFLTRMEGEERVPLLTEEETLELARHCKLVQFTRGETLVRQGDAGTACYVVVSGSVAGTVTYRDGGRTHTLEFRTKPGQVFGEMSLLTGAPRTATGKFDDEAELVEIPSEAFARFLAARESVMQELAERTAERNRQNAEFLAKVESLDPLVVSRGQDSGAVFTWLRGLAGLGRRLRGA